MKKMFTLLALLACFLGAKAEWVEDYSIDYSANTGFPFYVMGYVPEWVDGIMTDYGAMYSYKTDAEMETYEFKDGESEVGTTITHGGVTYHKIQLASASWHQYFIADGIPTEVGGSYTVKALVRASQDVSINVNMGWGWGDGQQAGTSVSIPASSDFVEVEWEYSEIGGASCNLVAQPGGSTAVIEWKSLTVGHNNKSQRPTVWQEWLTSDGQPFTISADVVNDKYMGDAEFGAWPSWSLEQTDGINANWRGDRTGEICAWALTMGKNFDDQCPEEINSDSYRARPYPADIELEPGTSNHMFVVHAEQVADIEGGGEGSIAWSNQFWIQSPKSWKEGSQIRIKFRYKAEKACTVGTQIHKDKPSNYLWYVGAGDVNFTTEWQQFDKTITFDGSQATGWSLAFNLNSGLQETNTFYFDDLSWETMVLDEGYFIAGANTKTGQEYDFDNAVEFKDEDGILTATIGAKNAYVNQIMISTVRGNDAAFKSATLKPTGTIVNDPDEWLDYTESSLAKLTLPGEGIWKVYIDLEYKSMAFEMLEGTMYEKPDPVDIITNTSEIVVEAKKRQPTSAEQPADEEAGTPAGTGQEWDNQFWIVANREFEPNEETVVEFDYYIVSDDVTEARVPTQGHGNPGSYKGGGAGDITFTTTSQHFTGDFKIPEKDWQGNAITGVKSLAFNMAVIPDACTYVIKNVKWYLKDEALNAENKTMENLINATGKTNFAYKVVGGEITYFEEPSGIFNVINTTTTGSSVIYNLAGQRVSKDYKGVVIKNGTKYIAK